MYKIYLCIIFTIIKIQKHVTAENSIGRIILGSPSTIQSYPYQAAVLSGQNDLYCGGAIINKAMVLTAAHCTQ